MSSSNQELRLSNLASHDLLVILTHTNKYWGPAQRDRYRLILEAGLERIRTFPLIGSIDSPNRSEIRKFVVGHHIVFYEIRDPATIVVLRVLHERMNLAEWESIDWGEA